MKVSLWAEIRRLHEIEGLKGRAIARRLHCCTKTVSKALAMPAPAPSVPTPGPGESLLDPYRARIDALLAKYPDLSAVRILEEISRGEDGYRGSVLSQRKADFYQALVHALEFYGGSPRKVIFDNLKAAVLSGSGRYACLHPEFLALCGHFCLEPIACARRDPESKGIVEAKVRYVKQSALAGRSEELVTWEDYRRLAPRWRDTSAVTRRANCGSTPTTAWRP